MAEDATTDPTYMHYAIDRVLPYPAAPLFAIAADVKRYPEFLPGWVAVRTKSAGVDDYETDQLLAFGPIRERFDSKTHLEPPHTIRVVSTSRTFRHFEVNWRFDELDETRCRVHLDTHVGFRSRVVKKVVGLILPRTVDDVLHAFEDRAHALVGESGVDRGDAGPHKGAC
ncbi:MAG: type II toxin-antitoxin system RatA family toxin [Pseudomonadota bacterium]